MSSLGRSLAILDKFSLPAMTAGPAGRPAPLQQSVTSPGPAIGHYRGGRAGCSTAASFKDFTHPMQSASRQANGRQPGFVRPDLPSVVEASLDEEFDVSLEEVDMATLTSMQQRTKQAAGAQRPSSALAQASYLTNNVLYNEEKKGSKGRFGMLGL